MGGYCTRKKVVWFVVLFTSLSVAIYQIMKMIRGWQDRPFDLIEERVSKHDVMFPSVTVCAEGATLWPALEVLLTKRKPNPDRLPKTFTSYVRVQMRRINEFYGSTLLINSNFDRGCLNEFAELGAYCLFMTKVFDQLNVKVARGSLVQETEALFNETSSSLGLFTEQEVEFRRGSIKYQKPYDVHEKKWYRLKKKPEVNWKLVTVYLHLLILKTVWWKANHQAKGDVMEYFLSLIEEQDQPSSLELDECLGALPLPPIPGKQVEIKPPPLRAPTLFNTVTKQSLYETNKMWLPHFKTTSYNNMTRNADYLDCYRNDYYKHMWGLYVSLVYLQTFDFRHKVGNYVTSLMRYNTQFDLPFKGILDYTEEINSELKAVLEDLLQVKNIPWSLKDVMDMLVTKGLNTIRQKSSWNEKLDNRRQVDEKIRQGNGNLEELRKLMDGLDNQDTFPIPALYWTSLSRQDEACLHGLTHKVDPSQMCQSYNANCTQFCQTMRQITDKSTVARWFEIMEQVSHPATFQNDSVQHRPLTWLLPFCFARENLYELMGELKLSQNYHFQEDNYYGYEFCKSAKQMYSDAGICTTYNFPDYSDLLTSKARVFFNTKTANETNGWVPLYPEKAITELFEDGILLVLDSWSFDSHLSTLQDEDLLFNKRGTPIESVELNNFKIVLHDKDEVPLIYDHDSTVLSLDHEVMEEEVLVSAKSYHSKIDVQITYADNEVKTKDLAKRNCKFPDETGGIKFFKRYSERSCLFECKLRIAKRTCGCVPWYHPRSLQDDNLCGIFGNICFQQEFVRLKKGVDPDTDKAGSPPCGCYPDCRRTKYVLAEDRPAYKETNCQWLDMSVPAHSYDQLSTPEEAYNISAWDELTAKVKAKQFLYKYVTDPFRLKESLFTPGRETLYPLDIRRWVVYPRSSKATTWEGRVRNLVLLFVDFKQQNYQKKKLVVRVAFADMVSSLGGILGLFTGFSIITLVDIMFWAFGLTEGLHKPKNGGKRKR